MKYKKNLLDRFWCALPQIKEIFLYGCKYRGGQIYPLLPYNAATNQLKPAVSLSLSIAMSRMRGEYRFKDIAPH